MLPQAAPQTLDNVRNERKTHQCVAGSIVCQELTFQNQSDGIWLETLTTGAQGPIFCCKGNRLTWGTMKRGTWVKPSGWEWAPWKRCNMGPPSFALLNQPWFISSALWSCLVIQYTLVLGYMYKHLFPSRAWIVDPEGSWSYCTSLFPLYSSSKPVPYMGPAIPRIPSP